MSPRSTPLDPWWQHYVWSFKALNRTNRSYIKKFNRTFFGDRRSFASTTLWTITRYLISEKTRHLWNAWVSSHVLNPRMLLYFILLSSTKRRYEMKYARWKTSKLVAFQGLQQPKPNAPTITPNRRRSHFRTQSKMKVWGANSRVGSLPRIKC